MNRLASISTRSKQELKSPAAIIGIVAIFVEVALFVLNRTLPEEQPGGAIRQLMSWLASAAPWLIPAILALCALLWLSTSNRRLSSQLRSVREEAVLWRERHAKLETDLQRSAEARTPKQPQAPKLKRVAGWEKGEGQFLIDNVHLEAFYERATKQLAQKGLDGELFIFSIWATPFVSGGQVNIMMHFWSKAVGREYTFCLDERDAMSQVGPGTIPTHPTSQVFAELPWREQPRWAEMVRLTGIMTGKLIPNDSTSINVSTSPYLQPAEWTIRVEDWETGHNREFRGTSPENIQCV